MKILNSRWLPLGLFAVATLALFRGFVFSDAMLVGLDTEGLGYAARAFYADALKNGNFPGWNPFILGGTPFLASLAGGDSLYPLSAPLLLVMETYRALGWKLVLHVFLAGVGMYGYCRALGVGRWAATVAGLGYLVAPHFVTLVFPAHDGKMFVVALTPFLFWAVHLWFRARRPLAWVGIALVVALVTLTTHFQMAYFLFLAVGAYGALLAVQEARGSAPADTPRRAATGFGLFFAASVVGVGVAAPQFLPALDYITTSSRRTATTTEATREDNKTYAASYSLHAEEAVSLLVPEFIGSSRLEAEWGRGTYWGQNPIKFNHEYMGLVVLLLAAVGFVAPAARRLRWYFLGMGGVALLYALGANTPVWHVAYAVLPGVSLFRAASMAIFLTAFALTALAAFGADRILARAEGEVEDDEARPIETYVVWGGAALGALIFLGVASGGLAGAFRGGLEPQRAAALAALEPFMARGALFALLLSLAFAGLAWAGARRKIPAVAVFAGLALLVTIDGGRVSAAYIETRDFEGFGAPQPIEEYVAEKVAAEEPFRLLDLRTGDGSVRGAMFDIELTWGHHPNDLARYRDLIGSTGGGFPNNLLVSENLLRLTNTRYVLWPAAQFGDPAAAGVASLAGATAETGTQLQDGSAYEVLYRVDDLPRARLVTDVRTVADDRAIETLANPDFPIEAAVVSDAPIEELGGAGEGPPVGTVEWLDRTVDTRRLRVTTQRPALLVVADNWYDGWRATVSGDDAEVRRVNLTQQGIVVPAGTHEVELVHIDANVRTGVGVSIASLLLLFAVGGAGAVRRRGGTPDAAHVEPQGSNDADITRTD
jgi:hypothetical protein